MSDYLRLVFGTLAVLLPGFAVARALGMRSVSAILAWSLASAFAAWLVVFAIHGDVQLAAIVLAVITAVALVASRRRLADPYADPPPVLALGVGLVVGALLWPVCHTVIGDGLFHEARVRKLVAFGDLHLRTVDEFKDGGLHPGYAFPLWHSVLALIAWVSGLDPEVVVRYAPAVLAPIACAVIWEAGVAVFGSRLAAFSFLVTTLALFCFGAGHGGSFSVLSLPATAARQMMVPAAVAVFFTARSRAGWATLAAIFGATTLTHPTYSVFLLIPLLVLLRWQWRNWLVAAAPTALVLLWLRPIVAETISHTPGKGELLRGLQQYKDQLVIYGPNDFRIAPEVFGRSGALAVAALILLPVVAFALPRRWASFAILGTLVVLALGTVPWLFVHFSATVGLSQSRRAMGFAPLPFALVGALALVARRFWAPLAALAGGVVLQRLWPGDFEAGLHHGGPAAATWIALAGGLAAFAAAVVLRRRPLPEHWGIGAAAVVALALPVFVHGAWHWTPLQRSDPQGLPPGLVKSLRKNVPKGSVVIAPVLMSYRVAAAAPVYIVAAPVTHVAATKANRPYQRAADVRRWVRDGDRTIPKRYGATWEIRDGRLRRIG
jgi:hypothetical protein